MRRSGRSRAALEITDASAVLARFEQFGPEGVVHLAGVSSVAWSHQNSGGHAPGQRGRDGEPARGGPEGSRPRARVLLVGSGEEYGRLERGVARSGDDSAGAPQPVCGEQGRSRDARAAGGERRTGSQVVLLRPFNHLGRGQAPQFVMPSFARQLLAIARGQGRCRWSRWGTSRRCATSRHVGRRGGRVSAPARARSPRRGLQRLFRRGPEHPARLWSCSRSSPERAPGSSVDPARLRPAEIPWLVGDPGKLERLGWRRTRQVRQTRSARSWRKSRA